MLCSLSYICMAPICILHPSLYLLVHLNDLYPKPKIMLFHAFLCHPPLWCPALTYMPMHALPCHTSLSLIITSLHASMFPSMSYTNSPWLLSVAASFPWDYLMLSVIHHLFVCVISFDNKHPIQVEYRVYCVCYLSQQ